jgi:hypothetical protein
MRHALLATDPRWRRTVEGCSAETPYSSRSDVREPHGHVALLTGSSSGSGTLKFACADAVTAHSGQVTLMDRN